MTRESRHQAEAAARGAYEYRRVADRETGRTVAWVRFWLRPSMPVFRIEESTCRSGIWEPTGRLWRIDRGEDDYAVETVEAATVEEALRDVSPPEHRYFAVVHDGHREHGLNHPAEILRVRTGQEKGSRERLGAGWEPYDMIDGVAGLRKLTLLEVDDEAVAGFRAPATAVEQPSYIYHEILLPGGSRPIAVVRVDESGRGEEAAVGWPVWSESQWLKQIRAGKVRYQSRPADPATVERFLRQADADRTEFRYFAVLDGDEGLESPWSMVRTRCREDGEPWKEEFPLADGTWRQSFHLLEIRSGRGSWWREAVEVPRWMFDEYRARKTTHQ